MELRSGKLKFRFGLVVFAVSLVLINSCGRKGGLEPPPPRVKTEQEKNRPDTFILDPLIQ